MKRPEGFDRNPEPTPPAGKPSRAPRAPRAPESTKSTKSAKSTESARAGGSKRERRIADRQAVVRDSTPTPLATRPIRSAGAEERAQRRIERAEARRFTRTSRRRRVTWLIVGALVLAMVAVLGVAIFSPVLALRTIRVEGTRAVKASDVRTALDDQLGTPLALLNTGQIDKDLSRFILIRSYVTEIVPPNTLVVRIEERQAIGVIRTGTDFEQVDPAGVVLGHDTSRHGLPVIDIGTAKVGGAAFQAAVKVLLAMPASVARKVQTITASTLDNVSLTLSGTKHTVIWGSAAQSDEKARVLAVILSANRCRAQKVLNLTAPEVVACGNGAPSSPPATPSSTAAPPAG